VIHVFEEVVFTSQPTAAAGGYALRIGQDAYWDGFPPGSPDFWSNFIDHSDDSNVVFVFDREKKRAMLKSARAIRKGDELFLRYDSYHPANPRFGPAVRRPPR
jgi:SET domain